MHHTCKPACEGIGEGVIDLLQLMILFSPWAEGGKGERKSKGEKGGRMGDSSLHHFRLFAAFLQEKGTTLFQSMRVACGGRKEEGGGEKGRGEKKEGRGGGMGERQRNSCRGGGAHLAQIVRPALHRPRRGKRKRGRGEKRKKGGGKARNTPRKNAKLRSVVCMAPQKGQRGEGKGEKKVKRGEREKKKICRSKGVFHNFRECPGQGGEGKKKKKGGGGKPSPENLCLCRQREGQSGYFLCLGEETKTRGERKKKGRGKKGEC